MRRTVKTITESGPAVITEAAVLGNNVLKNCRVLGFISRNKRIYPREVVAKALELYEGVPVNIDHPDREGPRKYEDRFGQITNVRIDEDGIYGDLTFNPAHPLAESFRWWASNMPNAIGLSHNAEAKTKFQKDGYEYITSVERVLSVDVVSDPGSTNGLFEHYNNMLENKMKEKAVKEADMDDKDKDEKKESKETSHMDKDDEKKDEKKEASGMDFFEAESKVGQLKSKFMEVVNDEDKVLKLLSMLDTSDLTKESDDDKKDDEDKKHEAEDDKKDDEDKKHEAEDKKDDEDNKKEMCDYKDDDKKTEESLRSTNDPAVKKLLEQLDAYRIKEHKEKMIVKAKDSCAKAGIPAYAVTDTFLNTLMEADESGWSNIIEDRRKICLQTKTPISTGMVDTRASIKDLVKFLVEE